MIGKKHALFPGRMVEDAMIYPLSDSLYRLIKFMDLNLVGNEKDSMSQCLGYFLMNSCNLCQD